jgi:acyl-CoA synthetase (NDP forming)
MNDIGANLRRLLSPSTLAVVGANEKLGMSNNAVLPTLQAGRAIHLINPNRDELYGQKALPSLTAAGEPVDAVLSLVNAERTIGVLEEAAELGCGGVVVAAAGFVEMGEGGAALQERLQGLAADAGMAVIGPNCSGFKNVPLGVNLFTGGRLDLAAGGVSVVSQSGFLTRSALAAAQQRRLGVAIGVSSGNEAVCDLADHVDALVDDEHTTVICLVIEKVRRPPAFFTAVARARAAGKPVLALKLGRSDRARRIVQSHTGAIADDSWVYDIAFREHGIISVSDIDELLDAAQLFAQLPPERHRAGRRVGMITTSGGVAALATDIADDEDADLPSLDDLAPWIRERVPGDTVNPLDLTGFVMSQPDVMQEVFARYADAVDALVLGWWLGEGDEGWSRTLLEPFAAAAEASEVPFVVSPVEATSIGSWVDAWRHRGIVSGRGVRSVYRAVRAMDEFVSARPRRAATDVELDELPPPPLVATDAGRIVGFDDAMRLLADAGVPVAPYVVLAEGEDNAPGLGDLGSRLVVKLADVPHRTELGAVALGVSRSDLPEAVARMRVIATAEDLPGTVAVQQMVGGGGEAFAGLQCRTDLGALVLFGMGGVLVEVTGRVGGRLLPVERDAAVALVEEVAGAAVFARLRGQDPWPVERLVDVVLALGELWRRHGSWLASVDVNPLIVDGDGAVAVDALLVASDDIGPKYARR